MKFFNNLPKTTFSTTLGNFNISDFFTYLDVDKTQVDETTVAVDDKTTLVEAAHNVYKDVNSIWAFVAANNTINPFDLVAPNSSMFATNNADKINLLLFPTAGVTSGAVAFPEGSIIMPYTSNTGASSSFGSTGNFDVNGSFAIIEATSFYDGNMIIGPQETTTFISVNNTQDHVTVIKKNTDGSYTWSGSYYTSNKKYCGSRVIQIVSNLVAQSVYSETVTGNVTIDAVQTEEAAPEIIDEGDGAATAVPDVQNNTVKIIYTAQQTIDNLPKQISAYVPSQLGYVNSSFVTTKYN